jgi:hypothetical protein
VNNPPKLKYKLYIGKHPVIQEIYIFLKSTSKPGAVKKDCCIIVQKDEWLNFLEENKAKYMKKSDFSYFDITKKDSLNIAELDKKYKESNFVPIAKLPETKCSELLNITSNLKRYAYSMSPTEQADIKEVLSCLIDDTDMLSCKLIELGLNFK